MLLSPLQSHIKKTGTFACQSPPANSCIHTAEEEMPWLARARSSCSQEAVHGTKSLGPRPVSASATNMPWESLVFLSALPMRFLVPAILSLTPFREASTPATVVQVRESGWAEGLLTALVATEQISQFVYLSPKRYVFNMSEPTSFHLVGTVHPDHFHWDQPARMVYRILLASFNSATPQGYSLCPSLPTTPGFQFWRNQTSTTTLGRPEYVPLHRLSLALHSPRLSRRPRAQSPSKRNILLTATHSSSSWGSKAKPI